MSADLFRKLSALNLSNDQIAGVMEIMEAEAETRNEKARARWRKWKDSQPSNVGKRLQTSANVSSPLTQASDAPAKEENKQTNQEERKQERAPVAPAGFSEFWALFPNKVGKRDAEAAFIKALHRADLSTILDGLRRYAAKTDDRPWCNPSTFLHQDRWADQPAEAVPQRRSTAPPAHQGDGYNAVLNGIINGKHDEHAGPTIDTSYDRTDRGSSANLVQFDAFSKGYRS